MSRKLSRELAMKLLYQLDMQKESQDEQVTEFLEQSEELTEKNKQYIKEVVDGVLNHLRYIDELIEKYAQGWKLGRLSKVDLAIIRLAVFELNFREDIPTSVAINEAIELAKKFSGPESGAFVNGILGKISEIRKTDVEEKAESPKE